jgi:pilus assembly protein Flp/PilA
MNDLITTVIEFHHDDNGVTAIEYSLIAALIAIAIILAVTAVGQNLQLFFNAVAGDLANA